MADPVAAALLVILAAAYVGGAVLVVTGLGKILLTWWADWRARTDAVAVDDALRVKASAAMNTVAAAAGVAPPETAAVTILGSSIDRPRPAPRGRYRRASGHPGQT